jgi:nicotinate-nucleotide pyrophosphorylase (carboxylating)
MKPLTLPEIVSTRCIQRLIDRALEEDVGPGDATSEALVPARATTAATVLTREPCVLAGVGLSVSVFQHVDPDLELEELHHDGEAVAAGEPVLRVRGSARAILAAERVALNFLQRLAGIATLTRSFVERVEEAGLEILDTRKTTPGMRILEKYAVRCGGGRNHRMGLYDRVMIKDNHRALWGEGEGQSLAQAVETARRKFPGLIVEVEVETRAALEDVLVARPDWVLLDNMAPEDLRDCAERCRGRCKVEASGGITMENLDAVAASGVDAVSLGALTHSARAIDFSLELEGLGGASN